MLASLAATQEWDERMLQAVQARQAYQENAGKHLWPNAALRLLAYILEIELCNDVLATFRYKKQNMGN